MTILTKFINTNIYKPRYLHELLLQINICYEIRQSRHDFLNNFFFFCSLISILGLEYLTRLRLRLNHLHGHKIKHSFLYLLNPICSCSCGFDTDTICHYLLRCPNFVNEIATLLDTLSNINVDILRHNGSTIVRNLLYGDPSLNDLTNTLKLNTSVEFLLSSKRFYCPLM